MRARRLARFVHPAIFLFFLSLTACSVGTIRGMVVDAGGRPIENATIQTLPPTQSLLSTHDGFVLRDVEDGEYSLIVSKEGYKTGSARVEVRGKKLTYANVVLEKAE